MNKKLTWLTFGIAAVGMGVTMPSCPGQQAMQDQIDALKQQQTMDSKKTQAMTANLTNIASDVTAMKQVVGGMGDVGKQIQDMNTRLTTLEAEVKALKEAPKPSPAAKGKRRR